MTEEKKAAHLLNKSLMWHIPMEGKTKAQELRDDALEIIDNTLIKYNLLYIQNNMSWSAYNYCFDYWLKVKEIVIK